jgi:putative FmdB family regulatory protein
MPTYGYKCGKGHEFEVLQGINEAPLVKCTQCGARVKRIFYPVGIVFKGSGFYKTDSRGKGSSTVAGASSTSGPGSDSSNSGASAAAETPSRDSDSATAKPAVKADKPAAKAAGKETRQSKSTPA